MKRRLSTRLPVSVQQSIMKGAIASARIEGIVISEEQAQRSLKKAMSEIRKAESKNES
jgi:hypothetical protein